MLEAGGRQTAIYIAKIMILIKVPWCALISMLMHMCICTQEMFVPVDLSAGSFAMTEEIVEVIVLVL